MHEKKYRKIIALAAYMGIFESLRLAPARCEEPAQDPLVSVDVMTGFPVFFPHTQPQSNSTHPWHQFYKNLVKLPDDAFLFLQGLQSSDVVVVDSSMGGLPITFVGDGNSSPNALPYCLALTLLQVVLGAQPALGLSGLQAPSLSTFAQPNSSRLGSTVTTAAAMAVSALHPRISVAPQHIATQFGGTEFGATLSGQAAILNSYLGTAVQVSFGEFNLEEFDKALENGIAIVSSGQNKESNAILVLEKLTLTSAQARMVADGKSFDEVMSNNKLDVPNAVFYRVQDPEKPGANTLLSQSIFLSTFAPNGAVLAAIALPVPGPAAHPSPSQSSFETQPPIGQQTHPPGVLPVPEPPAASQNPSPLPPQPILKTSESLPPPPSPSQGVGGPTASQTEVEMAFINNTSSDKAPLLNDQFQESAENLPNGSVIIFQAASPDILKIKSVVYQNQWEATENILNQKLSNAPTNPGAALGQASLWLPKSSLECFGWKLCFTKEAVGVRIAPSNTQGVAFPLQGGAAIRYSQVAQDPLTGGEWYQVSHIAAAFSKPAQPFISRDLTSAKVPPTGPAFPQSPFGTPPPTRLPPAQPSPVFPPPGSSQNGFTFATPIPFAEIEGWKEEWNSIVALAIDEVGPNLMNAVPVDLDSFYPGGLSKARLSVFACLRT